MTSDTKPTIKHITPYTCTYNPYTGRVLAYPTGEPKKLRSFDRTEVSNALTFHAVGMAELDVHLLLMYEQIDQCFKQADE
jgi:hypothetical protein